MDDLRYGFPGRPKDGLWGVRVRLDAEGRPVGPGERFDRELPRQPPSSSGDVARDAGDVVSVLSRLLDATIVLSFDRTGYRRHAESFRPADLQVDLRPRGRRDRRQLRDRQGHQPGPRRARGEGLPPVPERGAGPGSARELREATGSRRLRLVTVDVAEPDSVRCAVGEIGAEPVHVLVNNAAVLPRERGRRARRRDHVRDQRARALPAQRLLGRAFGPPGTPASSTCPRAACTPAG